MFIRTAILSMVLALSASTLGAGVHAVLPGCCSNVAMLSAVDPATGAIRSSFTIGPLAGLSATSVDFALSSDGTSAYILSFLSNGGLPAESVLNRVSLRNGQITASFSIPGQGLAVKVNSRTHVVYLTYATATGKTLAALDPTSLATLNSTAHVPLGGRMSVSPRGDRIYLSDYSSGAFQVVAAATLQNIAIIPKPGGGVPIPSPDGSTLYVPSSPQGGPGAILFVDATTFKTTQVVQLSQFAGISTGSVSPDGGGLYFGYADSLTGLNYFAALNLESLALVTLPVNFSVSSVSVALDGSAVYLGSGYSGQAVTAVYNTASKAVTATYPTITPMQVALNRTGTVLYELAYSVSAVAETSAVPSETIAVTAAMGPGLADGAYDAKDGLILIPQNSIATGYPSTISVYDAASLKFQSFYSFQDSIGPIVTHEGTAYVFEQTYFGPDTIQKVNPSTGALLGSLSIPVPSCCTGGATGAAVSADGRFLYAAFSFLVQFMPSPTASGAYSVTALYIVDTSNMGLLGTTIPRFDFTGGLVVAANGNAGYYVGLSLFGDATVVKFDLKTGATLKRMPIPNPQQGDSSNPVLSPDGSILYISAGPTLFALDAGTLQVTNQVALGATTGLTGLSITPDGSYLYATNNGQYSIYSAPSLSLYGTIAGSYSRAATLFVGR